MKVLLACSSGGHLYQMSMLTRHWKDKDKLWVSFPTSDAVQLLEDEKTVWAHYPTNRSIKNFLRNLLLAHRVLRTEKPGVVISTGAGVGVPFVILGRLMGIPTIYVESITRREELSLSGRLCLPVADKLVGQCEKLADKYEKAE
ncbi:MAG: PssD/Cps14F family polysaccharide biosynthesis glycosyltransferase, partial [Pseudomonadota bacterium]